MLLECKFQREIPRGEDASLFDNLAASMEDAAKKSALARFFVPFTRVSWNIAETGFRTGVGVGYRTSKAIGNSLLVLPLSPLLLDVGKGRPDVPSLSSNHGRDRRGRKDSVEVSIRYW